MSDSFCLDALSRLPHGGRIRQAAARYGIALEAWLDLSTGINPNGWRVPQLPASTWSRLPEDEDELQDAARTYYGTGSLLAVAGTQAAIQALPLLRAPCRAGVLYPGYTEHAYAWRRAGHEVVAVRAEQVADAVSGLDVLVLTHPNNPTGARFPPSRLLDWHLNLCAHGGWLVLDEAFIDATPAESLAAYCPRPGLVVLRSLGKFFGLAGARVGFVLASDSLLRQLRAALGPWSVAGPSRWVAIQALRDRAWHRSARTRLVAESGRLQTLFEQLESVHQDGCALFRWMVTQRAVRLHDRLARRGILTRVFTDPPGLRLGLPGSESAWERLETALKEVGA